MSLRDNIAANIEAACQEKGISQSELARLSGCSRPHLNRIIQRKAAATVDVCEVIAKALGIPAPFLFVKPD